MHVWLYICTYLQTMVSELKNLKSSSESKLKEYKTVSEYVRFCKHDLLLHVA